MGLQGAVSEFVAVITDTLSCGLFANTMIATVVHRCTHQCCGRAQGGINLSCVVFLVTLECFWIRRDIVFEELQRGYEVIGRHKVSSFWNRQIVEIGTVTPVPSNYLAVLIPRLTLTCSIDPVDLTTFFPKVIAIC